MNHTLKNQVCKIAEGTIVSGKWHRKRYKIIKALGYGATGYVYLANSQDGLVALKISEDSMAITSEVNVLRHFSKVQGSLLGPSLLDVDDWIRPGNQKVVPFYVMEYMKGQEFLPFLQQRGGEWFSVLILQLLADLDRLHKEGWAFGDLKPENLLVVGPPPKIRWLDVGSTTILGRSIKEYTEFYDRGYWGLGSRKAEPSYDLFALAMIMINSEYPNRFSKRGSNPIQQLREAVQQKPKLKKYEQVIIKALDGNYQSAEQMRHELIQLEGKKNHNSSRPPYRPNNMIVKKQKDPKWKGLFETILVAAILLFGYLLYIYGQFV